MSGTCGIERSSVVAVAIPVAACGGGGGSAAPAYSIGGTVSGLAGSGLVLRNDGRDDLRVAVNGLCLSKTSPALK